MLMAASAGQSKLGFSKEAETAQLRTIFNMGLLSREEGKFAEAEEFLGRALDAEMRLYGMEAYSTLRCRLEVAVLKIRRSTPGVAEEELKVGIKELESALEV